MPRERDGFFRVCWQNLAPADGVPCHWRAELGRQAGAAGCLDRLERMVPSSRRGGNMVSRWFPAQESDGAGGGGRTLTSLCRPYGFSYRLRLSPPGREASKAQHPVCGLDYPFTVSRKSRGLGAARLVSTPSRTERSVRAWLGIAISGFPEFGQFCIAGFPASTQDFLKSVASANSATPAWPLSYSCPS